MSKEYSRTQRVARLLKQEIARLLQREVKDARIGSVTVTDVNVSPDLKHADVYVQVFGDDDRRVEAMKGLESAAGFMRTRLGRELRIRRSPELRFVIDRSFERAARIHELLTEADVGDESAEDGNGG
jgi:ribosome-binding factor A